VTSITINLRSPRAMNHMDAETKLVHARLEEWAKWAKDKSIAGFPTQSLTEKAAQYGRLGIPQESNYRAEPSMPERVAVVDAAISRLDPEGKLVIRAYYLTWQPQSVMARQVRLSERAFRLALQRARWRITGFLDAQA
jgi:hypothetical protein